MPTSLEILKFIEGLRLKKARALALYLFLSPGRTHRKDKVLDLLWRESDTTKANNSFRQTVRKIRVTAETEGIDLPLVTDRGEISMDLPKEWDLVGEISDGFENPDHFGAISQALQVFFDVLDLCLNLSDSFDSWVNVTRAQTITRLQTLSEPIVTGPQSEFAYRVATFLTELDPYNESCIRAIMTYHWHNNASAAALDTYNHLYEYLDVHFDQEPESETIELLAAIKMDPDGGAKSPTPEPRQILTLVVESIEARGASAHDASFQRAFVDDLTMRLSRFREWNIADTPPNHSEYHIVSLALFSFGDGYSLSINVRPADSEKPLWSEIIEAPQTRWNDKARRVLFNVANALRVAVADRKGATDQNAIYDQWLRSLALIGTWTHENVVQAVSLLTEITQQAPTFGAAHAELAGIYNIQHILRPGTFQSEEIKSSALHHALEAVNIDSMDTRAYRVLAWCYCHKSDFDLAEFHFDQALLLNPQNPHSLASSALGFAFSGNLDRARELIGDVARLPDTMETFHLTYLAASNYLTGAYETALEQCIAGPDLMITVGGWHTASLAKLGRTEEARVQLDHYVAKIAKTWFSDAAPTARNVIDWFVSCFPLRHDAARQDLLATLHALIAQDGASPEASVTHLRDVDSNRPVES
jgi:DNA-binding SARP family transcriptional activator